MSTKTRQPAKHATQGRPYPDIASREASGSPVIEPLFNDAFVRIFGREESRGITRSLVNAVLSHAGIEAIGEITSIEAEHTSVEGSVNCKAPRMDVRIVASSRRIVDLEAQCYPEDIENRSLLYASQLISANTTRGTKFKDIPQAIVITLLDDAPLFPDSADYVSTCRLGWRASGMSAQATDRMLFVLVELEKVRRWYNSLDSEVLGDELLSWLYLLTSGFSKAEEAGAIMDAFPDIEEFAKMYGFALDDPKVVQAYADFESAEREYQSRKDYFERVEREARERGFDQGVEEGIEQGIEQGIAALRAAGMDEAADLLAQKTRQMEAQ